MNLPFNPTIAFGRSYGYGFLCHFFGDLVVFVSERWYRWYPFRAPCFLDADMYRMTKKGCYIPQN